MKNIEDRPARGRIPRSRGALIGLFLVLLGAWGALIPFVGPNFEFAYTQGQDWTAARGWLEVLPGLITAVGGVLLILSRSRGSGMLGGWLAALGGAWFVVGRAFAPLFGIGSVGDPVGATERKRAVLEVAYFSGLGALITFLAGAAIARVAVLLARDVRRVSTTETVTTDPATHQTYAEPVAHHPDDVSSQALTAPQAVPAANEPQRSGFFRRHRAPVTHPQ